MRNVLLYIITGLILFSCNNKALHDNPDSGIRPWSEDPRYWEYNNSPVLLLGAFDHGHNPFIDGSTLDTIEVDSMEDIIAQIDEMLRAGGNVLRCVLDPGRGVLNGIESFKRDQDGKFDLDKPDGPYWERLALFIAEAEQRDIIVELEIWDRFDWWDENWENCPFNPLNNINYELEETHLNAEYERRDIYKNHPMAIGVPGHPHYDSISDDARKKYDLVRGYQEIYVSKIYTLVSVHGNVLYNMNNETSEHPAWGEYWINFLGKLAKADERQVVCTNMQDGIFNLEKSEELRHQFAHPEIYDYLDISQINSRLRDEGHWNAVYWIAEKADSAGCLLHMTKLYGSDERQPSPWATWKPGDTDNAIEEWWRNLIAGVAGVRFHRPESGIGLSTKAKACIQATRKIESKVAFWDVEPAMNLLTERDFDEAYIAADPGEKYILYFTQNGNGSVGLSLEEYSGAVFDIAWVNIDTGEWGPESSLEGGSEQLIERPDGSAHWVAALRRQN